MNCQTIQENITITPTRAVCPIGEATGKKNAGASTIPVLSCEGACIRGEIARLTANLVAKKKPYGRGCHGELITVPDSAISHWIRTAGNRISDQSLHRRRLTQEIDTPVYLKAVHEFETLAPFEKVLIVPCRFCPAASLAISSNRPYFEFFRHLLQTAAAYERYIATMKAELEKRGVRADGFRSPWLHQFVVCMWTAGRQARLRQRA